MENQEYKLLTDVGNSFHTALPISIICKLRWNFKYYNGTETICKYGYLTESVDIHKTFLLVTKSPIIINSVQFLKIQFKISINL